MNPTPLPPAWLSSGTKTSNVLYCSFTDMQSKSKVKDKRLERIPKQRLLRDVFRHYLEFRDYVSATGEHVIDHGYFVYNEDGSIKEKVNVSISFWDLFYGLSDLSPRKREAVFYNVILDKKQRDVAEIMDITTVSVGQYVEQAMIQLAERYFAEEQGDNVLRITKHNAPQGPEGEK